MGKRMKKNVSNKKKGANKVDEENITQNKKQKNQTKNENSLRKVKDQSGKFKNKQKKNQKFLKQLKSQKDGKQKLSELLNSNMVNVTNVKKKGKGKKNQVQNNSKKTEKGIQKFGKKKQQKHVKNQDAKQMNKKEQNNKNARTVVEKKKNSSKSKASEVQNFKHKKSKKQIKKSIIEATNALEPKKNKQKKDKLSVSVPKKDSKSKIKSKHGNLNVTKLEEMLDTKEKQTKQTKQQKKQAKKTIPLRERMMSQLKASRFRYLNETMYNSQSYESRDYFKNDPDAFQAYHEGYQQQVAQWPVNPLDVIISSLKNIPKDHIIADFGCGEARLAASLSHKVFSFDFISLNKDVIVCDMSHTPLLANSVHIVVFCLSLMGTNLQDYLIEANRVLKKDGILKIAEVESRFDKVEDFIQTLNEYGFKNTKKDFSHNLFYFLDFKKEKDIGNKRNKLPPITLKPCLYKKR